MLTALAILTLTPHESEASSYSSTCETWTQVHTKAEVAQELQGPMIYSFTQKEGPRVVTASRALDTRQAWHLFCCRAREQREATEIRRSDDKRWPGWLLSQWGVTTEASLSSMAFLLGHSQSVHTLGESSQVILAYEKQMCRKDGWVSVFRGPGFWIPWPYISSTLFCSPSENSGEFLWKIVLLFFF